MFNPNSAFPRQTTYVPWINRGDSGGAINAPNFRFGGGVGMPSLPSTYGQYAASAQHQQRLAGGAPGVAAWVAARDGGGLSNQAFGAGTKNAQRRHLMGQGKPSTPEVDQISNLGLQVVGDGKIGAIAASPVYAGSARVAGQSYFGAPVSAATKQAVNENLTRALPKLGRTLKT